MNICLNYYGQPRNIDLAKSMFDKYIKTEQNVTYHILYTTWVTEDVTNLKKAFSTAFIKQYELPNLSNYENITKKFMMDPTNPNKTIEHYLLGFYIKKMSDITINEYVNINNVTFDFIITMRTDIYLSANIHDHYTNIMNNIGDNTVFVAHAPKFIVYGGEGQNALPDVMFIANKHVTEKIVKQIDILDKCSVKNHKFFHPESSFYNMLEINKFKIYEIPIKAFPQPV